MRSTNLIGFEKPFLLPDEELVPARGTRAHCRLCGGYATLTNSHVLPQSVGNKGRWLAEGYTTILSGRNQKLQKRSFKNGISFFTTCAKCNSELGSNEDKTLLDLYTTINSVLSYRALNISEFKLKIKINKLCKAILYHIATANDRGPSWIVDEIARKTHENEQHIGECEDNFYVWIYRGDKHCIVRDFSWVDFQTHEVGHANILKLYPLGFAISNAKHLKGMTPLNKFLTSSDETEVEIPFKLFWQDYDDLWPATPPHLGAVLRTAPSMGMSMGMVAQRCLR